MYICIYAYIYMNLGTRLFPSWLADLIYNSWSLILDRILGEYEPRDISPGSTKVKHA